MQAAAGMGTAHFPSTGFSPTTQTVGPESLSVAMAVKNAINDPRIGLKSDGNTQQAQQQIPQHNVSFKRFTYISLHISLRCSKFNRMRKIIKNHSSLLIT